MSSTTLTFSHNTTNFVTELDPPIDLDSGKKYQAALVSLHTYNSIPNITHKNNKFRYYNGTNWKELIIPTGAYEVSFINNELQRQMMLNEDYNSEGNSFYVHISYNLPTSKSTVDITHDDYIVDFTQENSIGSSLGFTSLQLRKGFHESGNVINIEPVNAVLVHCDIIKDCYVNGKHSQVLYSFSPKVSPGYKIIERPNPQLIFHSVINCPKISEIRIWLTDQNNKPIDLRGEVITIEILLKKLNKKNYIVKND